LQNPLARATWLRDTLLVMPPVVLGLATWGALAVELTFGMLMLHAFTFDPAWLGPRAAERTCNERHER